MNTSTEYKEGYELGIADCEYALKCSLSALNQHLMFWRGKESEDEEEAGYIQALMDCEKKLC